MDPDETVSLLRRLAAGEQLAGAVGRRAVLAVAIAVS